jgi:hypothetical protein
MINIDTMMMTTTKTSHMNITSNDKIRDSEQGATGFVTVTLY